MEFKSVYQNTSSFSETVMGQKNNAMDIEQASVSQDFTNEDLPHYTTTDMGLKSMDNVLMNKYYDKIKSSATLKTLTDQERAKYNRRPEALSTDTYDTPALWYLILYLNDCECAEDFVNLPTVLMPDVAVVKSCLVNEEYINAKDEK